MVCTWFVCGNFDVSPANVWVYCHPVTSRVTCVILFENACYFITPILFEYPHDQRIKKILGG